jgi:tRNA(Ile)-lysidine synthase
MSVLTGNLVQRVGEIISRYNILSAADRVGVAVSGGADSVALLHILHRLASKLQVRLTVLHVNHQMRGLESDGDESFVRELAASLGLETAVRQAPVEGGNVEQEARLARRNFFQRSMEQYQLRRVALGHTRSDQAETVLFRLLRGSGLAGLAAMRMVTEDGLIRPLLTTTGEEVRRWAREEGIRWRDDSSNAESRFARNRLRNEVMPVLAREFNTNLEDALAGIANLASGEEDYWKQQIEPIYQQIAKRTQCGGFPRLTIAVAALNALHVAVRRRVIRRALIDLRGDLRSIEMQHIEAILAICSSIHGHDRVIVPGIDALRSFDTLLLARPGEPGANKRQYRIEIRLGEKYELPFRAGSFSLDRVSREPQICANFKEEQHFGEVAYLDGEVLAETSRYLAIRNWEPGDEFRRPGHKGAEKIKSLFQEHRIVLWERRHWPVLVAGEEIVWVRRFGPAAKFSVAEDTPQAIRITYRPLVD